MVRAPGQGGAAALGGIVGYGSNIACWRPEGIHPLAHSHKGCIIGQCLHASIMRGHPCMQTDQTMSLWCRYSTYHMCNLMFLASNVTLPCIAWWAHGKFVATCHAHILAWGHLQRLHGQQQTKTGKHTGKQIQLPSVSSSRQVRFSVLFQHRTLSASKKKLLCDCATDIFMKMISLLVQWS